MLPSKPKLFKTLIPSIILIPLLAACNAPTGGPTATSSPIPDTETPSGIGPTDTASPIPPTDTASPVPATDTPALTATPTSCTNQANFVADVTVPDGTSFSTGESFVKTWRLQNTGTCPWTTQYQLVFHGGDQMGAVSSKALPRQVPPNDTIEVSVNLQAPNQNGTFRGLWMLRTPDGQKFGIGSQAATAFWVEINVGPVVHTTAQITVPADSQIDLDAGSIGGGADLLYEQVTATEYYLTPQGSAVIMNWGASVPSHDDCSNASKSSSRLQLGAEFNEGDIICYETNDGRIGRMAIDAITGPTPPDLGLDIRTWDN